MTGVIEQKIGQLTVNKIHQLRHSNIPRRHLLWIPDEAMQLIGEIASTKIAGKWNTEREVRHLIRKTLRKDRVIYLNSTLHSKTKHKATSHHPSADPVLCSRHFTSCASLIPKH